MASSSSPPMPPAAPIPSVVLHVHRERDDPGDNASNTGIIFAGPIDQPPAKHLLAWFRATATRLPRKCLGRPGELPHQHARRRRCHPRRGRANLCLQRRPPHVFVWTSFLSFPRPHTSLRCLRWGAPSFFYTSRPPTSLRRLQWGAQSFTLNPACRRCL